MVKLLGKRASRTIEPLLSNGAHGWRPGRSVQTAVAAINHRKGPCIKGDIKSFFGSVQQPHLKHLVCQVDPTLWCAIEPWLPPSGLPAGCAFSPALANLYLRKIDDRFRLIRYADNLVLIGLNLDAQLRRLERHLEDIGLSLHEVEENPTTFCKAPLKRRAKISRQVGDGVLHSGIELPKPWELALSAPAQRRSESPQRSLPVAPSGHPCGTRIS